MNNIDFDRDKKYFSIIIKIICTTNNSTTKYFYIVELSMFIKVLAFGGIWSEAGFSLWIFLGDTCPPALVKWGTSDNFRGQNISAAAKIAFDFKSCMNTPFLNASSIQAFQ